MVDTVENGRQAFARQAWGEAYRCLADAEPSLAVEDLERLAVASNLVGRDDESLKAWELAQRAHERLGDAVSAARCAVWLGFSLLLRGHAAQADGWLARAERLALTVGHECAPRGFVLVPQFHQALSNGALDAAQEMADEIVAIAYRCDDRELLTFGLLCKGEALIARGETGAGMKLLDEAMVSVATGEVPPLPAGIVYCAVIETCVDVLDLRRAAEWTDALDAWCATQPDLVPYRGQCLVHRSQVLQARGAWTEAASEAQHAHRHLADAGHPAVGVACYQLGELHRLQGEHADAEREYRAASDHGREPAPGFALLRLAEGDVAAAVGAIERMVDESRGMHTHRANLAAAVEIQLAAGNVVAARAAIDELDRLTDAEDAPFVRAVLAYATGSVALAEGDPSAAITALRRAGVGWRDLEMPYEVARARAQLALACRAVGDDAAADLELDAATATFERLGARPDLARLAAAGSSSRAPDGLTERECEVLRVVATGATNREVASELHISEHTVARHLQNIFAKAGLSSRAAATAYAHRNQLV